MNAAIIFILLAALKKALVPVHDKMSGRIGKEIIEDVYKATGFNPAKL